KTTCIDRGKPLVKALFYSREGHFSLRCIRGISAIRRRAFLTTSERCIGELLQSLNDAWVFTGGGIYTDTTIGV
ncbi:MAG: hypothetical protein ACFNVI_00930, partial [Lachnoanaerobaculum gingivalis]